MATRFSVIIPTLNEEKNLPHLLRDLVSQDYHDYEVVVVDAHSTDHTVDLLERWQTRLPLTIVASTKRNICFQRNLGAHQAQGEYLIFLDADIQLYKSYLSTIAQTIQEEQAGFLTTYQLPNVRNKLDIFITDVANYTLELLVRINKQMAPGYNFIVRREVFFKAGEFDVKTTFSEDHELSIRIAKQGVPLTIIPQRLLKWSFRRIKKDGRLPIIMKYTLATFYMLFVGKITDKNFSYPMGGEYFDKVLKRPKFELKNEFNRYTRKIKESLKEFIDI